MNGNGSNTASVEPPPSSSSSSSSQQQQQLAAAAAAAEANEQLLLQCKKEIQRLSRATARLEREKTELHNRLLEARAVTRSKVRSGTTL